MRKGISPLIAVVILVAATLAIATLVMNWSKTFTKGIASDVETKQQTFLDCGSWWIQITKVVINQTSGNFQVIVENKGTKDIILKQATLYVTNGSSYPINITNTTLPTGEFKQLNETWDVFTSNCNNFDEIHITTACGGVEDSYDSNNPDPTCNT